MCGRYTLRTPAHEIAELFDVEPVELEPRYNIAPTQEVPAVRIGAEGQRELVLLRWGLVPYWADDPTIGNRMINARVETVAAKPAFRQAFRKRRCLVVADGFYEWQKRGATKQPFYIRASDQRPFAFAGLWERWRKGGLVVESCTILVSEANDLVGPIHDRMPVILPREAYGVWLDPAVDDARRLERWLRPYPAELMEAYPVSTVVNKPQNDLPECIEPVEV